MSDLVTLSIYALLATLAVGLISKLIFRKMGAPTYINDFSLEEQSALLEAAIMTIYVDGRKMFREQMTFRTITKHVKWKFNLKDEMNRIDKKALRALQDPDLMQDYLRDIKTKITNKTTAKDILYLCHSLSIQKLAHNDNPDQIKTTADIDYLTQLEKNLEAINESSSAGS